MFVPYHCYMKIDKILHGFLCHILNAYSEEDLRFFDDRSNDVCGSFRDKFCGCSGLVVKWRPRNQSQLNICRTLGLLHAKSSAGVEWKLGEQYPRHLTAVQNYESVPE
ncbi:hypothetical protein AVEN_141872-1 [Araneus ventricosus]|uniref:Uncharacterized protein n=1 Tax=Araneus ventricosus TaxID=182803 RepID=A0A4Y2GC52_ARAVE|nr:hypothetical protein AVEN_141872-1 [Araneus ventricosus]